jgi:hypothetical protein
LQLESGGKQCGFLESRAQSRRFVRSTCRLWRERGFCGCKRHIWRLQHHVDAGYYASSAKGACAAENLETQRRAREIHNAAACLNADHIAIRRRGNPSVEPQSRAPAAIDCVLAKTEGGEQPFVTGHFVSV